METQDNDAPHAPLQVSETVQQSSSASGWSASPELPLLNELSPRQREVFRWICEGKRDREIALILGISYRTVTVHVRAILSKLGVENRTSAAMMGARLFREGGDDDGIIKNTYFYVLMMASEMLVRGVSACQVSI